MTKTNTRKIMPGAIVEIAGEQGTIYQRGQRNFNRAGVLVKGASVRFASRHMAWFPYDEMTLVREAPKADA
jgi:hypothetical protein